MKNFIKNDFLRTGLILVLFFSLLVSCQKQESKALKANKELYELMQEWYLWYKDMPKISPSSYINVYHVMEALRVNPPDRWSFVTTKKEFDDYFKDSKFVGYGFGSAYDGQGKLRISFIFNTVELYNLGVRRSWIIKSINGIPISGQNINQMLGANQVGVTNNFVFIKPDGTEVSHTVAKQEITMNTVLHYEVIDTPGGKVGYLVFQSFTGTSKNELNEAFQHFQTNGPITDLVLDLRYNGGGAVSAANHLASSILSSGNKGDVFVKYIHNDKKTGENTIENLIETSYNLNLRRLFVLATRATASASELIINGLKPYIEVFVIGDTTHGKPTGMYGWYYDIYAFVPVAFTSVNKNNEGGFYTGIPANKTALDDTSRQFGDPEEACLKEALYYINNGTFSGIIHTKSMFRQPWEDFTGLRAVIMSH